MGSPIEAADAGTTSRRPNLCLGMAASACRSDSPHDSCGGKASASTWLGDSAHHSCGREAGQCGGEGSCADAAASPSRAAEGTGCGAPQEGVASSWSRRACPVDRTEEAPVDLEACETMEATNAVAEAFAPAPELVYPKGRPVSYGPGRPFMELQDPKACQEDADVPETVPKPASEPAPAEDASPPPEPRQELPGQAEALEALKALMAELGGMGFKVPKKPTGEPEAGRAQGKLIMTAFEVLDAQRFLR